MPLAGLTIFCLWCVASIFGVISGTFAGMGAALGEVASRINQGKK